MNNNLVIQCILTVIGWIVVYILALRQNTQIKKKEVTIKFLVQAWERLEKASNRQDNSYNTDIETAIADIQLFGTKRQIELAQQFAEEIARKQREFNVRIIDLAKGGFAKRIKVRKGS